MKKYNFLAAIAILFLLFVAISCEDGIDDISPFDPGPDVSAPEISLTFPSEGTKIQVPEPIASINITFEVSDDIEIDQIDLILDGTTIETLSEFKDYRRYIGEVSYDNVTNGAHTLVVRATDLDGKESSVSVNFEKVSPYTPLYDGEILYMPFDGNYSDLISFEQATVVGTPGFGSESVIMGEGVNSYKGAADSYLTFPTANLGLENGGEFSAVFWTKVNPSPNRAGILVIGPPDEANPTSQNNRTNGFRFFREAAGDNQRFKLNVGHGAGDSWFDGGANADVDPTSNDWEHMAFTISANQVTVYINGEIVSQGDFNGVDWTGCDIISIMSGAPRFVGWNHLSDESLMDELRLFNRSITQSEIRSIIETESGQTAGTGYSAKYEGETFYMPFEGEFVDLVTGKSATPEGSPTFAGEGYSSDNAYLGAAESYLTYSSEGLLSEEFSAAFWMKINSDPDRAGILVVGPPDPDNPDSQNNRTSGFRFFREGSAEVQRFKLNVGTGMGETWIDGGEMADVTVEDQWVHFAISISSTDAAVFINGVEAARSDLANSIDWTDCDILSIMSGAPRFVGWNHLSDAGVMDELRLFNRALSVEDVTAVMNDE